MYTPNIFEIKDQKQIAEFIEKNPFATIISQGAEDPCVTHIPLVVEKREDQLVVSGHFAKANSHWRSLHDERVLLIFKGPHGYISPSWYNDPREVPTWNYMAVHCFGIAKIIHEVSWKMSSLKSMSENFESQFADGKWKMDEGEAYVVNQIDGIVGIEIEVKSITAKFKLGQNRSLDDQKSLVAALMKKGSDYSIGMATALRSFFMKSHDKP